MDETTWSRYEAGQYADTPQNWKHLQARKGQFQEIHPGYFAARGRFNNKMSAQRNARCSFGPFSRTNSPIKLKPSGATPFSQQDPREDIGT